MALKKDITFKGITIPEAYHKVYLVQTTKLTTVKDGENPYRMTVNISIKKDKDAEEILNTEVYDMPLDLTGDNQFVQAYNGLKSLPEYSTAIDT